MTSFTRIEPNIISFSFSPTNQSSEIVLRYDEMCQRRWWCECVLLSISSTNCHSPLSHFDNCEISFAFCFTLFLSVTAELSICELKISAPKFRFTQFLFDNVCCCCCRHSRKVNACAMFITMIRMYQVH